MTRRTLHGLLLLTLLSLPSGAAAQVPSLCPGGDADFDRDGFSDAEECAGVSLRTGLRLAPPNDGTTLPNCALIRDRSLCMDPATRDLFAIFDQTTLQVPLPPDALAVFARLGVTLHKLVRTNTETSRRVSDRSPQNAIQIATNPDTASGVLGRANWGTPNNLDGTVVFPNRIASYVNGLCAAGKNCRTQTGLQTSAATIIPVLTRWVADHEAGHTLALSGVFTSRYGGYHEATGSLTVMEQTPKVVDKRGAVTFYIGDAFSSASAADATIAGQK